VETKEQVVVGVNDFVAEEERGIPTLRIEPQIEREQIERLKALRGKRDGQKACSAIGELQRRAATKENLMPSILGAVEAYCTVGEISDALRRVFGEYQESVII
jgi:methylmalonyl-CoA mutase N-terminal domain/subunit